MAERDAQNRNLDHVTKLSVDHCILLAVHYASESNIDCLRALGTARQEALGPELFLRIILTYLPESFDPALYTSLVDQVANGYGQDTAQHTTLDTAPVKDLSDTKARKRVKHLHILPLDHTSCPVSLCDDLLTRFLIHRAHRIDTQTGLLTLITQLFDPFLDQKPFLRSWYISTVLPLLRLGYEYYNDGGALYSLDELEAADGEKGVSMLLSKALGKSSGDQSPTVVQKNELESPNTLARDMRGLVGPWMYGANDRKRRKLNGQNSRRRRMSKYGQELESSNPAPVEPQHQNSQDTESVHEWDSAFTWMAQTASQKFQMIADTIEEWNGPEDVDLGGYHEGPYLGEDIQQGLHLRYVQTAFASVFAAETATMDAISKAHEILVRITVLMGFEPPPDLATSVELLPRIDDQKSVLEELPSSVLNSDALLQPNHPLTAPSLETFSLLQLFVFSAYLLAGLGYGASVVNIAKIRFQYDAEEQFGVFQRIVHTLSTGPKRDEQQWALIRTQLLWLWGWAMDKDDVDIQYGFGIFGKIERATFEKEMLGAFLNTSHYALVANIYLKGSISNHRLSKEEIEKVVIETALQHYDNASNGNKTRGGMKRASEIISSLRKYFLGSHAFRRCEALIAATHALSFYKLTLQHGVPFQPVNIRVSSDPITLIEKVLSQNPNSYTNLDDLISIGTNLVAAGVTGSAEEKLRSTEVSAADLAAQKRRAERRVIGMAIEAALNEDDFETAYSYVVNRLDTTSASARATPNNQDQDDISWRAALAAGRHKTNSLSASSSISTPPVLRRLEQRMELLSQAILLAPGSALTDVLNVWRKCEEEMTALQARETEEDITFNDRADLTTLPGAFVNATAPVQPRREVGRGANEEAPMGLFDVARGAAAAFSRSAFPLRATADATTAPPAVEKEHTRQVSSAGSEAESLGSDGNLADGRVRKRDMVASAVTGGLASGIGWVLGATPVTQQQTQQR